MVRILVYEAVEENRKHFLLVIFTSLFQQSANSHNLPHWGRGTTEWWMRLTKANVLFVDSGF